MRLNSLVLVLAMVLPGLALAEPLIDGPSQRGETFEAVEQAFRARVTEAFPDGTTIADLEARLTEEGFTFFEGYAEVKKWGLPCNIIWRVLYSNDNGLVTDLDVVHGSICL
jgi:hypothetical protein